MKTSTDGISMIIVLIAGFILGHVSTLDYNRSQPQAPSEAIIAMPEPTVAGIATVQDPEYTVVNMMCTGYCTCQICCGKWSDGICADNKPAVGKFIAADRKHEFGTLMAIPGYNDGQPVPVRDRGGKIKGDHIDLFFTSHQEARQWGVKHLNVRVYK